MKKWTIHIHTSGKVPALAASLLAREATGSGVSVLTAGAPGGRAPEVTPAAGAAASPIFEATSLGESPGFGKISALTAGEGAGASG